jgi:hypothetical protein
VLFPDELSNPDCRRTRPSALAGAQDARRLGMSRWYERANSRGNEQRHTRKNASNRHATSPVQDPVNPLSLISRTGTSPQL